MCAHFQGGWCLGIWRHRLIFSLERFLYIPKDYSWDTSSKTPKRLSEREGDRAASSSCTEAPEIVPLHPVPADWDHRPREAFHGLPLTEPPHGVVGKGGPTSSFVLAADHFAVNVRNWSLPCRLAQLLERRPNTSGLWVRFPDRAHTRINQWVHG